MRNDTPIIKNPLPDSESTPTASDWNERYKQENTPWDLSGPTPEFVRLSKEELLFRPGRSMVIPGCGRGYDAIHFAQSGLAVTAIDYAPEAIAAIESQAKALDSTNSNKESTASTSLSAKQSLARKELPLTTYCGDFFTFADTQENQSAFDYLLEYTFFCAIPPEERNRYGAAAARILKKDATLVGLFFPLEERAGGPPYSVSMESIQAAFAPNFELRFEPPQASIGPRRGREILGIFRRL